MRRESLKCSASPSALATTAVAASLGRSRRVRISLTHASKSAPHANTARAASATLAWLGPGVGFGLELGLKLGLELGLAWRSPARRHAHG